MNEQQENLSAQQSLDIITSMIKQAKGNMKGSSFYYLVWGWTIAIANLGVFILIRYSEVEDPFLMFTLTIPAAIASVIYGIRQGNQKSAPTLIDQITKWMWAGFGVNCFILAYFGEQTNWQINPIIITMCAVPTLVSGIMLRFKPLQVGGLIFWGLGITSFLVARDIQFLVAAIAVILGYLIPGYLLKRSEV